MLDGALERVRRARGRAGQLEIELVEARPEGDGPTRAISGAGPTGSCPRAGWQ